MPERYAKFRGYSLALLAAACWAAGGLTAKWLFSEVSVRTAGWPLPPLGISMDPATLSAGRAVIAFAILLAYLSIRRPGALRAPLNELPFLVVFGVVGLGGLHFAYFRTISLTNVATAILLEYLAPVIVLVVSVAFLGYRATWSLPVGVALAVAGAALVVGVTRPGSLIVSPQGIAWGLVAAVLFAAYTLMGARSANRLDPFTTLLYGLASASVFWLIVLGPRAIFEAFDEPMALAAGVFLAVVSTIVPFSAFLGALRLIPPTNASVTSTVEPLIAGVGAFALFGEVLSATQLIGGVLVVAAIAIVQLSGHTAKPVFPPQD